MASWYDRKHQDFTTLQLEDQSAEPIRVNADEMAVIQKALAEHRKQSLNGGDQ